MSATSVLGNISRLMSPSDRKQAYAVLLVTFFSALIDVLGVASILPFMAIAAKPAVIHSNHWISSLYANLGFVSENRFLFFTGVVFFLLLVFSNVLSAFSSWLQYRFAFALEQRISERILASYLAQSYAFFLKANSAVLLKNILNDPMQLVGSFILPALQLVAKAVVALLIVMLLMLVDPILALCVAFALGTMYTIAYILIRRRLAYNGMRSTLANASIHKIANQAISGVKEIMLLGKGGRFVKSYSEQANLNTSSKITGYTLSLLPKYFIETMAFGGMLLILVYLIGVKKDVSSAMPLMALYALAGYRMLPAIQAVFHSFSQLRYNQPLLQSVLENYPKSLPSVEDESGNTLSFESNIQVDRLRFQYPDTCQPAINGLSMMICANTSVAFVGHTGSGKSTLVDIILGFLDPQEGGVRVDGVPLNSANMAAWRKNVGYVPQQIYLSDDSVASNIAFGCTEKEINMPMVKDAAISANLHEFVQSLPDGYQTIVGDRGVRLSGGQRQRIGIARALYNKPKVLVMDEATSALDGITEKVIIDTIQSLSHKLTIIMVAHRLTTVKECDVIYLLENGNIIQQGTFSELRDSNQTFQRMLNS